MTEKPKRKVGRPRKIPEVTPELLQRIEKYAGLLLTYEEIATVLDMSVATFHRMKDQYPEVLIAYKKGYESVKHQAVGTLRQAMKDGEISAAMFILKTRFNFREKEPEKKEESENSQPTQIIFKIREPECKKK